MNTERKIWILKSLSWRAIATSTTMFFAYVYTGQIEFVISIGIGDIILKMIFYYLHEKAWARASSTPRIPNLNSPNLTRSELEIFFCVLEVIQSGINTPTHIMYASNLSWNPLEDTLTTLIQEDFIRKRGTGRIKRYYITDKGARVLRYHQKSMEELQPATPEIKLSEINNLSLTQAKH